MELFKRGRVDESILDFDRVIALNPAQRPYMWQRGLSLYYLERHEEAVEQFAIDVAVNPNDTEETIWHFLCNVRRPRPPGAVQRPQRSLAFSNENPFCMGLLYGRTGRLTG